MIRCLANILIFAMLSGSPLCLLATDSHELKVSIGDLDAARESAEKTLADHKSELDGILTSIERLKEQEKRDHSLFRELRLQKLLKSAQSLSQKISAIASHKSDIEKDLQQKREMLFASYNRELEEILGNAKNDPSIKAERLDRIKRILTERSLLTPYLSPVYREGFDSFYIDPSDSAADVLAKAGILDDYRSRLNDELSDVEQKLDILKRQSYALNEISHLLDEESFFTETGFLKPAERKETSLKDPKDPAAAKSGESPEAGADLDAQAQVSSDIPQPTEGQVMETQPSDIEVSSSSLTPAESAQAQDSSVSSDQAADILKTDPALQMPGSDAQGKSADIDNGLTSGGAKEAAGSENTGADGVFDRRDTHIDTASKNLFSGTKRATDPLKAQIGALERERANLKKLIGDIESKRANMENEARRLLILKMK